MEKERALYNGVLSGVSLDGRRFFYANPLAAHPQAYASRPGDDHGGHTDPQRQAWFGCACCPPNVARLLASLGQYVYSQKGRTLFVNLFVGGEAKLGLGGMQVVVRQRTDVHVEEAPAARRCAISSSTSPNARSGNSRAARACRNACLMSNSTG